jgi:hypothetical protein
MIQGFGIHKKQFPDFIKNGVRMHVRSYHFRANWSMPSIENMRIDIRKPLHT